MFDAGRGGAAAGTGQGASGLWNVCCACLRCVILAAGVWGLAAVRREPESRRDPNSGVGGHDTSG